MSNMNIWLGQGNLVSDPEMRYTQSGKAVTNFTIAINGGFGDKRRTSFIDCSAFGKTAETLVGYVKKGRQINVRGELVQDKWEDKESGKNRSRLHVNVYEFWFVNGGSPNTANEVEMPTSTPEEGDMAAADPVF